MSDGAGAHRAGLNRHVEIAVEQTIVADGRSGFAQRKDLGVRRGIVGRDRAVASPAYDSALAHDDRSDGNLAQRQRTLRFTERFFHPEFVGEGHGEEANAATGDWQPLGYSCRSMMRWIAVARPVVGSQSIRVAHKRTSLIAASKRAGMLVRKRARISSFCTPMTPS